MRMEGWGSQRRKMMALLGDIERKNGVSSISSGGMLFSAPDVWPEGGWDRPPDDSGDPRRQIFENLNRFQDFGTSLGLTVGGFIPWVGDAMDVYDVAAPGSSALDRTLGGVSLGANAVTAGILPNFGPIKRGINLIRGVDDVQHHVTPPSGGAGVERLPKRCEAVVPQPAFWKSVLCVPQQAPFGTTIPDMLSSLSLTQQHNVSLLDRPIRDCHQ